MPEPQIDLAKPAQHVVQITLNRPRQFNALNAALFQELDDALLDFEKSEDRVLILTGTGRAFCFGADFQEFRDRSVLPELLDRFQSLIRRICGCPKVTIASFNGFASGAGLDLALACDLRIASDRVKLSEGYVSMGLVSDGGGSFFLPRMVGASRALYLLLTGESVDAGEAKSSGLVHQTCPAEELAAKTLELAQAIASRPQTAVMLLKSLVRRNASVDLETALRNEKEAQLQCFQDAEHLERVNEFLARRRK